MYVASYTIRDTYPITHLGTLSIYLLIDPDGFFDCCYDKSICKDHK